MPSIANPHDHFFKEIFSRPEVAEDFLRQYLPASVSELLALDSLEICKDSFVDGVLAEHQSDLLYQAPLRGKGMSYVYLLFEHKSFPQPLIGLDLLRYSVRIWEQWLKAGNKPPLPPIIPLVVYHGRTPWRVAREFSVLVEAPEALKVFVPSFQYHITDLSVVPEEEIRGQVMLRTTLLAFKHIFDDALKERLPEILGLLKELATKRTGLEYLETLLRYLSQGTDRIDEGDLHQALEQVLSRGDELMPTIAETWEKRGLQRGLQQGKEHGLANERRLLLRLVRRRFGEGAAHRSAPLLDKISYPRTFEALGDRLLDCGNDSEWLEALEEMSKVD